MKKLFALMLALVTLGMLFSGCGNTVTTGKATGSETETETEVSETETPDASGSALPTETTEENKNTEPEFDRMKLYEIKTTDGVRMEWKDEEVGKARKNEWQGTVWSLDTYTNNKGEEYSMFYAGDFLNYILSAGTLREDEALKLARTDGTPVRRATWNIQDNGDGTYKIVSGLSKGYALGVANGKVALQKLENASNFTITEVENENDGTLYRQWNSEKGNIIVRLPSDIVEQVYKRVKIGYKEESEESLKGRITDRMQRFADDVQRIYDAYVELTNFVPYSRIIVYAFTHQDVMAGVVGGDCNIYVNVDWYVDDMEKMWRRWEDGKDDVNFCVLHEMGHMFDWNRGWNFESEMLADLKATYVLYKYQNEEKGCYAAPAEYAWNNIWNIDTIDKKGYKGLAGSGMTYLEKGEELSYTYSIYYSAMMYTSYIKHCEATEGLEGYEALKKAFHWFQENNKVQNDYTGEERFNKFNELLSEYTGLDINEFMTTTYRPSNWKATAANAAEKPGKRT